jgi:hypothetical protein
VTGRKGRVQALEREESKRIQREVAGIRHMRGSSRTRAGTGCERRSQVIARLKCVSVAAAWLRG